MAEKDTGPKVEHITKRIVVSKPTIEELMEANKPYFAEIEKVLGPQAARETETSLRKELQEQLDRVQNGEIVDVPMVHIE